jgi:hypothetical protein
MDGGLHSVQAAPGRIASAFSKRSNAAIHGRFRLGLGSRPVFLAVVHLSFQRSLCSGIAQQELPIAVPSRRRVVLCVLEQLWNSWP